MTIVAITGSSGFVGQALLPLLRSQGHAVRRFVRRGSEAEDAIAWDPASGAIDAERCRGIEAVIHLAGEPIAGGRWSKRRMRAIDESRGPTTQKLCRALANLPEPPRALLSASAIGFYGSRGDELLDESSASGPGFLADVGRAWEAGTSPLAAAGARVVHLRLGIVLDRAGGALAKMLPPFRLGLGGPLGNGRPWMSCIARADATAAIAFLLQRGDASGAFNLVGPEPIRNRDFARLLGRLLHRPAVLPTPAFALRLLFGRMADEALLASQRVVPSRLLQLGFRFAHGSVESALRAALA